MCFHVDRTWTSIRRERGGLAHVDRGRGSKPDYFVDVINRWPLNENHECNIIEYLYSTSSRYLQRGDLYTRLYVTQGPKTRCLSFLDIFNHIQRCINAASASKYFLQNQNSLFLT